MSLLYVALYPMSQQVSKEPGADSIRSGRLVATYFQTLPPRQGNAEYYKKIRLPISLETIETKLKNGEFANLSQLEGDFKRMILNAKEYFSKSSKEFEDAERVRKALSNYMTKTNPAYQTRGYQALPTPFPDENPDQEEDAEDDEDAEGEAEEEADNGEREGEEGEEGDEDEDDEDDEANGDGDDEEEPEAEDEEEVQDTKRRPRVVLKRSIRGRPPKHAASHAETANGNRAKRAAKMAKVAASSQTKSYLDYEDVPYKVLTFQQAQEKIVDELLRKKDEDE
jgi:cobalamin biosynthesis protein CobT